jgi:hypothetical protein
MKLPHPLLLLACGASGALAWSAGMDGTSSLQAASSTFSVWEDHDGDGLDDALETRFGLSESLEDTDGDGYTDLEEALAGLNPLVPDNLNMLHGLEPKVTLEAYTVGADTVLTVTVLRSSTVRNFKLFYATRDIIREVPQTTLAMFPSDTRSIQTNIPGLQAAISRITLPTATLERANAVSLAVQVQLDGHLHGSEVRLSMVDGILMEHRDSLSMTRSPSSQGSGGGQSGGLFPTDGGTDLPGEVSPGKVCVQEISEVGSLGLGSGQKIYQVSNGYCDILPTAKCFSTCADTVGGTIIGIDIASLLGG